MVLFNKIKAGKYYYIKFFDDDLSDPSENIVFIKNKTNNEASVLLLACTDDLTHWTRIKKLKQGQCRESLIKEIQPIDLPLYIGWRHVLPAMQEILKKIHKPRTGHSNGK
jgi:hypothetical protein